MNPTSQSNGILNNIILRDEVYDYLRQQIISLEFPPGFRFDLNKLEKELGISRTPLNVALYRLEGEGLVQVRPRSGTFVTPITLENIAENFDVRLMLETSAAPIVLEKATDHELAQLTIIHTQMNNLIEGGEYREIIASYIALDQKLHHQYLSYARNKQLMRVFTRLNTHLQIVRLKQKFDRPSSNDTQLEHAAIVAALPDRDVNALQTAIADHVTKSKARTLAALRDDDEE
ncbi:MAG: DNA-binding GntR family transcriptional regulator [Cellvibrionaceae bacterium]|jgi:DNA-binding GntR family transcriptional regulator